MARLLSALLIAFALFCAPVAMHMGGAAMATPASGMDHGCEGMGKHSPEKQKPGTSMSCAVACAAIPGIPASIPSETLHDGTEPFIGPARQLAGIGPEAELPPPRTTPTI